MKPDLFKIARFDDLAKCHVCGAMMHISHMTRRGELWECPEHGEDNYTRDSAERTRRHLCQAERES